MIQWERWRPYVRHKRIAPCSENRDVFNLAKRGMDKTMRGCKNTSKLDYQSSCVFGASVIALLAVAVPSLAETSKPSYNLYGGAGLIDMPSGEAMPDAELGATLSHFGGSTRISNTFQITDRISGTFRYSRIDNWNADGFETYYDRSFDFRYQLMTEGTYTPAIALGIMDAAGTGLYSAEYIAATKNFTPKIRATVGLGWGRLGSYNSINSPFGARPSLSVGRGGNFSVDQFFRGPMAAFGGVEWRPTDKLSLKAEYSSDAYAIESGDKGLFERKSPFNFGIEYAINDYLTIGGYSMYGTEIAANLAVNFNPKAPSVRGSFGAAPLAVKPRPVYADDPEQYSTFWVDEPGTKDILASNLLKHLAFDKISMEAVAIKGKTVEVRIRNERFISSAQAIGRTARALSRTMPPSVETFRIVIMVNGMSTSAVTLKRSDIEALSTAPNGEAQIMARAEIDDTTANNRDDLIYAPELYPDFQWNLAPYVAISLFDPNDPVRWGLGARASILYHVSPGIEFSGAVTAQAFGSLGNDDSLSTSTVQHVRSDANLYDAYSPVALQHLQGAYFFQPTEAVYGRVSAGYLERMFGGVSTELLWKPVNKPYALGAELNYVQQRATDSHLGFQDYQVATGHVSAYYKTKGGFDLQLDVGQYLAGDVGATLRVNREFANGWRVGAFATKTDLSAEEFGEGSFDKGIFIEIPQSWLTGKPTRRTEALRLQALSRDGGSKLNVNDRLYDRIRINHEAGLRETQGRFWR